MRISNTAKQDFLFLSNTPLHMIGNPVQGLKCDPNGLSALEAFFMYDTHGIIVPCKEQDVLERTLAAKASWNLQCNLWAEDLCNGLLLQSDVYDYCAGLPKWIFISTINKAAKLCKQSIGFVPAFAQITTVYGNWWSPEMKDWSPII